MSIVTVIESIVLNDLGVVGDNAFIHGLKGWQNIESDEADFPNKNVVYLDEPITSEDTFHQGGMVESRYRLSMLFLEKSQLDYSPDQQQLIIDRMRALRREFILHLKAKKDSSGTHIFREISDVVTTDVHNVFDVTATGVMVTFRALPLNGDSVCL